MGKAHRHLPKKGRKAQGLSADPVYNFAGKGQLQTCPNRIYVDGKKRNVGGKKALFERIQKEMGHRDRTKKKGKVRDVWGKAGEKAEGTHE